jgi:hypothetical protein
LGFVAGRGGSVPLCRASFRIKRMMPSFRDVLAVPAVCLLSIPYVLCVVMLRLSYVTVRVVRVTLCCAVVASYTDSKVVYYENSGTVPAVWTSRPIASGIGNAEGAVVVEYVPITTDVNQHVASTVLCCAVLCCELTVCFPGRVLWHYGTPSHPREQQQPAPPPSPPGVFFLLYSINGDGAKDVLTVSPPSSRVMWHQNPRNSSAAWVSRALANAVTSPSWVSAGDLGG